MPNCSNVGCVILGTDPQFPKTVMTLHGPECEIYKTFNPSDPRCTCGAKNGDFHVFNCNVFSMVDDNEF